MGRRRTGKKRENKMGIKKKEEMAEKRDEGKVKWNWGKEVLSRMI